LDSPSVESETQIQVQVVYLGGDSRKYHLGNRRMR
jgi:hypothetical protein